MSQSSLRSPQSNRENDNDVKARHQRARAEEYLHRYFSSVVEHYLTQTKKMELQAYENAEPMTISGGVQLLVDDVRGTRVKAGRKSTMTQEEIRVFDTRTYRNVAGGFLLATTTFVGLLGLGVWLKNRKLLSVVTLPPQPKANYANLDRMVGVRESQRPTSMKHQPPKPKQSAEYVDQVDSDSEWGSLINQIQLIGATAVSVVVGILSSWALTDFSPQGRDVAKLPLQAGKSHLFDNICAEVVQRRMNIQSSASSRHWVEEQLKQELVETAELLSNPEVMAGMPTDQELWNEPLTPSLEAMKHMVINCQQRIQYIKDLKNQMGAAEESMGDVDGPFDIPEPGVPPIYLGIDVEAEIPRKEVDDCTASSIFLKNGNESQDRIF